MNCLVRNSLKIEGSRMKILKTIDSNDITSLVEMDVLEALQSRRTVRQYDRNYSIPKDVLNKLVDIALESPTARDAQGIDLVVVTNREKIDELTKISYDSWDEDRKKGWAERVETYGVKNVVSCDAPCLFFLVANDHCIPSYLGIDGGIMLMSIMAGCREFGLQSMCIGAMTWGDKAGVERALGVKEGSLVMILAVGKPVEGELKLKQKERKCSARFIE